MAEYELGHSLAAAIRRVGRAEKFATLLLLFILLTAATAGVSAVLTGPDWASLWESLFIGLLIGWVLAIFRWPAWRSALLVIGLGVLFCLLFAGGLSIKFLAVLEQLVRSVGVMISALKTGKVDLTQLDSQIQQLFSSAGVVVGRVVAWVKDLAAGQPNFDPVAAGIMWSFVVWLVAAWAGWVAEAIKNALVAVLPALALNLTTLSYGRYNSASIYLILGTTLMLISVVQYDKREQEWAETKIAYPTRKSREVVNAALIIAMALVVLAAFISSLSLQRIVNWVSELNRTPSQPESGLAKSLGIVPPATTVPDAFTGIRNPGLPRDLLIGAGPELSKDLVMSVEVKDLASLVQAGQLPPLYWRSYTYDIYTGHGWSSSDTQQSPYQPGQQLQPGQLPDHLAIQEVVRPVPGGDGTVYAAGEPLRLDVSSDAAWRSSNDLFGIQTGSDGYTVQSLIPVVNESNLRAAGQAYPKWVTQRYLALPAQLTARIKELAIQLTASEPTSYDRARAIEQYLRSTYPYTTDVPHPPANQDLVDYFLFDLRKGYCDYYASAMVVLSRAAGIPARLAVGYTSGTFNPNSKHFIVTLSDAHSWVEIFFPGIGWVPFEPTASVPTINRMQQPGQEAAPLPLVPKNTSWGIRVNSARYAGYAALALVVLASFTWVLYAEIHLRHLRPQPAAAEVYHRLKRYGIHLGVTIEAGETPYEYAALLSSRIRSITKNRLITAKDISLQVRTIINRIVRLSYRPTQTGEVVAEQIIAQWAELRWWLRLLWILNLWHSTRLKLADRSAGGDESVHAQAD